MLKNFGTEFKVGLFTIVALVTLGYMLFVLNPSIFKDDDSKKYYTVLKDAAGIIPKTQVKTNGVNVGKVLAVDLEINTTKITFDVDSKVKIPVGSKVEVRTRGLLGDVYIEVVRAADSGEYIAADSIIPKSEDAMDMQSIMALVGSIGKDVKQVTGTLANVLGTKKGEQSLHNILDNVETLTADLKTTGASIRGAIGDRPQDVKAIVTNLRDTLADLRDFSRNLKGVLNDENKARIDRVIAAFDDSMVEVKGATKNIRLISEKVERGEGTLGRLINDDTTLNEIEAAVKDIREAISPANKVQLTVDVHTEGRSDKSAQSYFNMKFATRPDRYYLVGLTNTKESVTTTESEVIESSPGANGQPGNQKVREKVEERQALKFNLQIAKRWYWVAARVGLFESTGGVAGDAYFFRDKLSLSLEAFDWDSTDNEFRRVAHFKAYASILFFNHIYVMLGADDITRHHNPRTGEESNKPAYFAGAGLQFNDQDLKAIFGFATLAR